MHKHTAVSAAGLFGFSLCLAIATPTAAQTRGSPADSIRPPASSDGAINTSRSNIKTTARAGRFDPLVLDLRGRDRSGASVSLTATIDESGEFSFGTPAAGEYVLTVRARESGPAGEAAPTGDVAVTLQGIAGGPVETVLEPVQAENMRLDGRIDSLDAASLSGRRPGKSKYKNIVLRADGRTEVRGTALDTDTNAAPAP